MLAHRLERALISSGHAAQQGPQAGIRCLPDAGHGTVPRAGAAYPHTSYSPPPRVAVGRPAGILRRTAIQNAAGGE